MGTGFEIETSPHQLCESSSSQQLSYKGYSWELNSFFLSHFSRQQQPLIALYKKRQNNSFEKIFHAITAGKTSHSD